LQEVEGEAVVAVDQGQDKNFIVKHREILDDILILVSTFIFVFFIVNLNSFLQFFVWLLGWFFVIIHELGHAYICLVGGGIPIIGPTATGFVTLCFGELPFYLELIDIMFGHIFVILTVFVFFYFSFATKEKGVALISFSILLSTLGWIGVQFMQDQLYRDFSAREDIPRISGMMNIGIDSIITFLVVLIVFLIIFSIRLGLKEEEESKKIFLTEPEKIPYQMAYPSFFRFIFIFNTFFTGVSFLVVILNINFMGGVIFILLSIVDLYLYFVQKAGYFFRDILNIFSGELKIEESNFEFLSAKVKFKAKSGKIDSIILKLNLKTLKIYFGLSEIQKDLVKLIRPYFKGLINLVDLGTEDIENKKFIYFNLKLPVKASHVNEYRMALLNALSKI